jgi:hypothetical protein
MREIVTAPAATIEVRWLNSAKASVPLSVGAQPRWGLNA